MRHYAFFSEQGRSIAIAINSVVRQKTTAKVLVKKDNLKRISGIGYVLEKRLNRLSVERFKQIARFSEVDMDRFSKKIGAFPDRILRDNWIGQVNKLS